MATPIQIVQGLHAQFIAAQSRPLTCVLGEPSSVQITPYIYTILDSFEVIPVRAGGPYAIRWRFLHRLLVLWQEGRRAEQERLELLMALLNSMGPDESHLGTTLISGEARISDGLATVVKIGDVLYWATDIYSSVLDKNPG